jgi:hypothetical protein
VSQVSVCDLLHEGKYAELMQDKPKTAQILKSAQNSDFYMVNALCH